jgi:hypothetical protein
MLLKQFCLVRVRRHCILFVLLAASCSPLVSQSRYQLTHERDVPVPLPQFTTLSFKWSGHNLIDVTDDLTSSPVLVVVHGDHEVERIAFDIPGVSIISVRDYAVGPDGAVALCGIARGPGPKLGTFISWVSPDRKRKLVTRVWPFVPERLTLAADGTIWAAGNLHQDPGDSIAESDIVQRFDFSGKPLSSSSAHPRYVPGETNEHIFASHFFASRDRVGWLTFGNQYIEYSLTGLELGRYEAPALNVDVEHRNGCGAALSEANDLAVCIRQNDNIKILTLDRATRKWEVALLEKPNNGLLGYDGETLVMTNRPRTDEPWLLRRFLGTRTQIRAR